MNGEGALSESKTMESINAAAVAAEAAENARKAQMEELLRESDERTRKFVRDAISEAFGENKAQGRYIDVSRIPLICQNIDGIHATQLELKDMVKDIKKQQGENTEKLDKKFVTLERFSPVEKIVYGAVSLILVSVLGALVALVVIK